jgi:hypothetical protein
MLAIIKVSLFVQKISANLNSLRESSQPQGEASIARDFPMNPMQSQVKLDLVLIKTPGHPLNYLNLAMVSFEDQQTVIRWLEL